MKIFDKLLKKAGKTASDGAMENVKTTVLNVLPTIVAFGGVLITAIVFSKRSGYEEPSLPSVRDIQITTNNYYYYNGEE